MSLTITLTDEEIGLVVEAVLVILIAFVFLRHAYLMHRGTEARRRSLVGWAVVYGILGSTTITSTLIPFPSVDVGVVVFLAALDTACAIVAGVWTYRHVDRTTTFEWRTPGVLFYRMRPFIPLLYTILFLAEVAIELATLGVSVPGEGSSPDLLPAFTRGVLRLSDLLLSICAGIIIGASVAIYGELRQRRRFAPPPSAAGSAA